MVFHFRWSRLASELGLTISVRCFAKRRTRSSYRLGLGVEVDDLPFTLNSGTLLLNSHLHVPLLGRQGNLWRCLVVTNDLPEIETERLIWDPNGAYLSRIALQPTSRPRRATSVHRLLLQRRLRSTAPLDNPIIRTTHPSLQRSLCSTSSLSRTAFRARWKLTLSMRSTAMAGVLENSFPP